MDNYPREVEEKDQQSGGQPAQPGDSSVSPQQLAVQYSRPQTEISSDQMMQMTMVELPPQQATMAGGVLTAASYPKQRKPLVCQVKDCNADLSALKEYHQRYKICDTHLKISEIWIEGRLSRFCQQCGRFQERWEFDGAKRSCRARLQRHNARRRKRTRDDRATDPSTIVQISNIQPRAPGEEEGQYASVDTRGHGTGSFTSLLEPSRGTAYATTSRRPIPADSAAVLARHSDVSGAGDGAGPSSRPASPARAYADRSSRTLHAPEAFGRPSKAPGTRLSEALTSDPELSIALAAKQLDSLRKHNELLRELTKSCSEFESTSTLLNELLNTNPPPGGAGGAGHGVPAPVDVDINHELTRQLGTFYQRVSEYIRLLCTEVDNQQLYYRLTHGIRLAEVEPAQSSLRVIGHYAAQASEQLVGLRDTIATGQDTGVGQESVVTQVARAHAAQGSEQLRHLSNVVDRIVGEGGPEAGGPPAVSAPEEKGRETLEERGGGRGLWG